MYGILYVTYPAGIAMKSIHVDFLYIKTDREYTLIEENDV